MTGPQDFDDQDQTRQGQGQGQPQGQPGFGQQGFGEQYPGQQQFVQQQFVQPGFAPARPPRQKSQVGARLKAFVLRDVPALVAAGITLVMGLLLLVTPHLAWLKDNSFDIVAGTMTLNARGSINLSSAAQRELSEFDALEIGFLEIMLQAMLTPFAGMLTLSAFLVLLGGLLMITTARQLGAVVAIMGVVPQVIITAISVLTVMLSVDSSPTPSQTPDFGDSGPLDLGFSAGVGVYLTGAAYVVVIICAVLAALRREGVRPPAPAPAAANTSGPMPQYPDTQQQPYSQPYSQPYGPEGQPPAGS